MRDYEIDPVTDPLGPTAAALRVLRGGSWDDYARPARSAHRYAFAPGYRFDMLVFAAPEFRTRRSQKRRGVAGAEPRIAATFRGKP